MFARSLCPAIHVLLDTWFPTHGTCYSAIVMAPSLHNVTQVSQVTWLPCYGIWRALLVIAPNLQSHFTWLSHHLVLATWYCATDTSLATQYLASCCNGKVRCCTKYLILRGVKYSDTMYLFG